MQQLLVEAWQALRRTVVFVTHDVDEALLLGDRVVVLGRHGVVAEHARRRTRATRGHRRTPPYAPSGSWPRRRATDS